MRMRTLMMTMKKSTQSDLSSRVRLQLHTSAEINMKCKRCSMSRAGCRLMMKQPSDEDIQRRLGFLREDLITGLLDTTKMDPSVNPLSKEDKAVQIQKVRDFIQARYPNADLTKLPICFSFKKPMDIVVLGPKSGETKIILDNGSDFQKSFVNLTFAKRALG